MENTETIAACFRALLRRPPSETECASLGREMKAGLSLEAFLEKLLQSAEFAARRKASAEFVPAGHFYSVIPSEEARAEFTRAWPEVVQRKEVPGIALDSDAMERQFERIQAEATHYPFPATQTPPWRYHFENPAYAYADGLSLYTMLRRLRPKRIVEVGSGYSSALMLDMNEFEFDHAIDLTFIEPFPELLFSFFRPEDHERTTIYPNSVQKVDESVFDALEANDILFIDSTHVAKLGSDVNFLFLEVLPRLRPGVHVHVHDIFWPFEYSPHWINEGRAWNETYLLRALLQDNNRWEILYFSHYVHASRQKWIKENAPLIAANGGGHIWLKRRAGADGAVSK